MKLETVNLKKHPTYNEKWVQERIAEDPSILGLGDLSLRDKEKILTSGGRLDLLLIDPDSLKRYEVEIQLGSVDESHIIRTIEYWDIERKRYPQYDHAAVIVAEDITSRFLNVISLFNGAIPLIALKMTAYKVGDEVALTFVKVLDEITYGPAAEDEPVAEPTDREYWKKKSSEKSLKIMDSLMQIVTQIEPTATPRYNKHYIGLTVNNSAYNFISLVPQKNAVIMKFKITKSDECDKLVEATELEILTYETVWRQYQLRIDSDLTQKQRDQILELAQMAKQQFGQTS